MTPNVIELKAVAKVFLTDEVETHARNIHLFDGRVVEQPLEGAAS